MQHVSLLLSFWPRATRVIASVMGFWLLAAAGPVQAQTTPPGAGVRPGDTAVLERMALDFLQPALDSSVAQSAAGLLRPEVVMGQLDTRLRLTPCNRVEPYLPTGTRLWGRSRIGLRCVDGPVRWNVFVPVTVKAWGPAWVLRRPVTAGHVLTEEDAEMAEIDWAEQHASVLASPELWVGQQAAFALQPGQALRQNMVRQVPVFGPGAQVRVSSAMGSLQVVVTGQALGPGLPGQSVRVRLPGGRVVTGTVVDGQTVEVLL